MSKEQIAFRVHREWQRKKTAVEAQGGVYGLRTIARRLAVRHDVPAGLELRTALRSRLRQIQRYLKANHMPSAEYLVLLAEEFDCAPEVFGVDTRDQAGESDDDPSELIERDLLARLRSVKREIDQIERMVTTR